MLAEFNNDEYALLLYLGLFISARLRHEVIVLDRFLSALFLSRPLHK